MDTVCGFGRFGMEFVQFGVEGVVGFGWDGGQECVDGGLRVDLGIIGSHFLEHACCGVLMGWACEVM